MNIKEAIQFIENKPGKYFTLGVLANDGREVMVNRKIKINSDAEGYLTFISQQYPGKTIFIEVFAPNGSSYKKLDRVHVEVSPSASLSGITTVSSSNPNMDVKDLMLQIKEEKINELQNNLQVYQLKARKHKKIREKLEKQLQAKNHEEDLREATSSGLNGLANSDWVKELLPVLGKMLSNNQTGAPAELDSANLGDSLDKETIERIQAISQWFSEQEKTIKDKVWMVLHFLANENNDTDLYLSQILNLLKNGTTIGQTGTD